MDWLKGKIGKSGVLAADDIPEAVKAEVVVKEQKEREEQEAEEAAKKAAEETEAVMAENTESEFEAISPKKKSVQPKAKKPAKTKTPKKNEDKAIADAKTEESADVIEEKAEEKIEEETEEKAEEKIEEKTEEETEEQIEEQIEEKVEEKTEEKIEEKIEEKAEEKAEEKIEEKAEEKIEEKIEEKTEAKTEEINSVAEEKPEEIESAATEERGEAETKEEGLTSENDEKVGKAEAEQLNLFTEDYYCMANDDKATKKVAGKWMVKEKGEGEYVAFLYANNREVLLTSETYSTVDGAKKGVATIQKNATDENFAIYKDKNDNYYFKLKNSKNRFLCVGETYPNRNACLNSIESVKKFVDSPISDAVEKDITLIKYVPTPEDKLPEKKYSGKWVIKEEEGEYRAQLHASNGELLLCSESYASYASAKEAIGNISQNGIAGNFIVDCDKKGRYFFKLRNATKVTLCIGETYSQLQACLSAIDSVRSFLKTAKLADNQ